MKQFSEEDRMLQFPVFQLSGGTAVERACCVETIEKDPRFRHLATIVVTENKCLRHELCLLSRRFDAVIVDGLVDFPLLQIHVGRENSSLKGAILFWDDKEHGLDLFCESLLRKIDLLKQKVPIWACILIGGKSSRMGRPKHLLPGIDGRKESWLERTIGQIEPLVEQVVVSGKGELPESLATVPRIPDIPGVAGPLTGVLSAMRWQPDVSWLVIACDMPFVSAEAAQWLLSMVKPGCWGNLPRLKDGDFCEPLFAWYDSRAGHLLEEQLLTGNLRVGKIASHHKIDNPLIPDIFASSWQNVNTPEQLQSVQLS